MQTYIFFAVEIVIRWTVTKVCQHELKCNVYDYTYIIIAIFSNYNITGKSDRMTEFLTNFSVLETLEKICYKFSARMQEKWKHSRKFIFS